ncbi:hypothetical protein E2562_038056 [Oryza meyeriana var. granulata]|uniref:Uncharacterized protein n=1 Tax=Oryza meyeriana var. granulata TaxID=110450 RepID=A0A6G1EU70_9ORYZ|nr:hypothetical protein E2562_038056 [Oryza meyeriana var. granulata]
MRAPAVPQCMLRAAATTSANEEAEAAKSSNLSLPAGGSGWLESNDDEPEPDAGGSTMWRSKTTAGLGIVRSSAGGPRWQVLWRRRSSVASAVVAAILG